MSTFYPNIHHLFLNVYILNNTHNPLTKLYIHMMNLDFITLLSKSSYILASYCVLNESLISNCINSNIENDPIRTKIFVLINLYFCN